MTDTLRILASVFALGCVLWAWASILRRTGIIRSSASPADILTADETGIADEDPPRLVRVRQALLAVAVFFIIQIALHGPLTMYYIIDTWGWNPSPSTAIDLTEQSGHDQRK